MAFIGSTKPQQNTKTGLLAFNATFNNNCRCCPYRVSSGSNKTRTTNCRLGSRDWRSLNQTKSQNLLKTLNCLRLARRSVKIADVALTGCHQATTLKQQNWTNESRDWHSLDQIARIRILKNSELSAYDATFNNNCRCLRLWGAIRHCKKLYQRIADSNRVIGVRWIN